jgi:hypothetical protein
LRFSSSGLLDSFFKLILLIFGLGVFFDIFSVKFKNNNFFKAFVFLINMGVIGRPEIVDEKNKRFILEMEVGDSGFIELGSLVFDRRKNPYLSLYHFVSPHKDDLYVIPIKRTSNDKNGYEIDLRMIRAGWVLENIPFNVLERDGFVKMNYEPLTTRRESLERQFASAIEKEDYFLAKRLMEQIKTL